MLWVPAASHLSLVASLPWIPDGRQGGCGVSGARGGCTPSSSLTIPQPRIWFFRLLWFGLWMLSMSCRRSFGEKTVLPVGLGQLELEGGGGVK